MGPTNVEPDASSGQEATRLTRRATNAAAFAVMAFVALFVVSAQIQAMRARLESVGPRVYPHTGLRLVA